jgi:hypothetical protein
MKQAQEKELQLTQHALLDYTHTVSEGTEFAHLLKPEYWAHVAQKLRPHTLIKVIPEDGSYWAELLVLSCDRLWAKVHVLRYEDLTAVAVDPEAQASRLVEFDIQWKGPVKKHVVIRKSDSTIITEGIQTKGEAQIWLEGHLKTIAG